MPKIFATNDPTISKREIDHMKLSRSLAEECSVLLENDGTLPLKQCGKLALFGSGARQTVKGGTGSGDVNTRSIITIEQGLKEAGFEITTTAWLDRFQKSALASKKAYVEWLKAEAEARGVSPFSISFANPYIEIAPESITDADIAASDTDTAVYVISRNSGEGSDRCCNRGDYLLYEEEKEQLALLGKTYAHVVLVLNIGGVMDMTEIRSIPGIGAVLLMTQLGNIGGQVLADLLMGKVTPSGKLTDTWAKAYSDYPSSDEFSHNDENVDDEFYREGIFVGYRYFDTFGVEPMYPFGYGISYTTFEMKTVGVKVEKGVCSVSVSVTNTGDTYAGKQVVQVYVTAPEGKLTKPYQELKAYAKTKLLKPGETEIVTAVFEVRDLASYCEHGAAWVLEPGEYIVRAGEHSRSTTTAAVLTLSEKLDAEHMKNLFAKDADFKEPTAPVREKEDTSDVAIRIELTKDDVQLRENTYQAERPVLTTDKTDVLTLADVESGKCTLDELVAQLTVQEMADLCVGTRRDGASSVVGDASYKVPGAAGDSSAIIYNSRGVKNMILADGPAGLRLQPVFKTDKQGNLLPGGNIMGDVVVPFDPKYTDDVADTYYQYCTAIPIGWALAQSWNSDLLRRVGDMIGVEMDIFGIDLWLAPALNIHRNPLCGRNFEYYSEDPLVAGITAASISGGVQSHPGKGVTIKHFACNNQEDNRNYTNSHVSERALREIYLKGFEITVRNAKPFSIMTSYNLINGIHAANSWDLLQSAARDEWGFDGVVMTDWFASVDRRDLTKSEVVIYPASSPIGCVYAGNDIQMPGGTALVTAIVDAVENGTEHNGFRITLADLQYCAKNVIRGAMLTSRK